MPALLPGPTMGGPGSGAGERMHPPGAAVVLKCPRRGHYSGATDRARAWLVRLPSKVTREAKSIGGNQR